MTDSKRPRDDIYEAWVSLSESMRASIEKAARESKFANTDVMGAWADYNRRLNEDVLRFFKDEERVKRARTIMKRQADRIEESMARCIRDGGKACSVDFYGAWTDYAKNAGDLVLEVINAKAQEQKELYELWMDSYGHQHGKDGGDRKSAAAGAEPDSSGPRHPPFGQSAARWPGFPGSLDYKEYSKNARDTWEEWSKAYSAAMKEILRTPEFAKWAGDFVGSAMEQKAGMSKMTEQYLRYIGFPTQGDIDGLRKRLHEIEIVLPRTDTPRHEKPDDESAAGARGE